jgi:cell division protein FtsZ
MPISEYARKAAPQGPSSPGHNLIEEDVLDIPAFLRRKAI